MASVPVAPPFRGQSGQVPIAVLKSPFCQRLINYKTLPGKVELRKGSEFFAPALAAVGDVAVGLFSWNGATPQLILVTVNTLTNLEYFEVDSAGSVIPRSVNSAAGGVTPPVQQSFFRNNLFFFGNASLAPAAGGPNVFNGTWISPMPTSGYTFPANFVPSTGAVHKNRHYIVAQASKKYGYSDINAIAGAITEVDLSDLVTSEGVLLTIKSLGLNESTSQQNVAAFIFSNGEILIYEGSYPDSDSWGLASRFSVADLFVSSGGSPFNGACDAKGDTFIFTSSEILSVRNLFVNGYEAEKATGIGAAIQSRWQQIVAAYLDGAIDYRRYVNVIYDSKRDRLIAILPVWIDPDTGLKDESSCGFLIYAFQTESWYEYKHTFSGTGQILGSAYHRGDLYYVIQTSNMPIIYRLESSSGFMDKTTANADSPIAFDFISAPLDIQKFGTNAIEGVEVISKSDMYEQVGVSIVADLGRVETSKQFLPAQGTTTAKPLYNVGINDATFSQIRISGSTVTGKTVGHELYAMNVWYSKGQEGSR